MDRVNIMASIAETLIDLHEQLVRKYNPMEQRRLMSLFHSMTREDCRQLLPLCRDPGRMVLVGLCFLNGKGVPKDEPRAFECFKKSADLGNHDAMNHLAECYRNGTGVAQDEDLVITWYQRSAELGNSDAMTELGDCYCERHDDRQGFEWFKRSADLGNPDAMINLAQCYHRACGVAKDEDLAVTWYQKAIDAGTDDDYDAERSLDDLLRNKKHPQTYVRYYCQQYESCDPDGWKRRYYKDKIFDDISTDEHLEIIRSWCRLEGETERWATQVEALTAKIEALTSENETLRTELTYQPGGTGYREAMHDFVTKAHRRIPDTGDPADLDSPQPTDDVPLLPDG